MTRATTIWLSTMTTTGPRRSPSRPPLRGSIAARFRRQAYLKHMTTTTTRRSFRIAFRLIGIWIATPLIWFALASALGSVAWYAVHGQAALGPYGRDKSLSNLAVELPAALILVTIPFPFTLPGSEGPWWRQAAWVTVIVSALVTLLIPGLPE